MDAISAGTWRKLHSSLSQSRMKSGNSTTIHRVVSPSITKSRETLNWDRLSKVISAEAGRSSAIADNFGYEVQFLISEAAPLGAENIQVDSALAAAP